MKSLNTLVVALLVAFLLLVPDIIPSLIHITFHKSITFKIYALTFVFSIFLVLSKSWKLKTLVLMILLILQMIASGYIAYFGSEIMPEIISKFFHNPSEDTSEITTVFFSSFLPLHMMVLSVAMIYGLILILLYKAAGSTIQMPGAGFIMVGILIFIPARAILHSSPHICYTNPLVPSVYNVINSFGLYMRQLLYPNQHKNSNFLEYETAFADSKAQNIVVIMGESTRSDYMSLLGHHTPTTPLLDKRSNDPNFIYRSIFSGGVATESSIQAFFNLMLEPGNFNVIVNKKTNLFRIAKQQGYKTILISAQSSMSLYGVGTEYIDHFISREGIDDDQFSKKRDLILIDHLDKISLSEKNFIVLHLRTQHVPYESNYSHMKELAIHSEEKILSSDRNTSTKLVYENSMRFSDFVIEEVIKYTQNKFASKRETYLFFTADHGELLGEGGLFGHHHLNLDCAKVPLLILGFNASASYMQNLKSHIPTTHYDLGILIARLLGVTIHNPNISSKTLRYIHGGSIMYPYSYLEYEIDQADSPINLIKRHTSN